MKKYKIVTHAGSYHSDDICAVATLALFLAPAEMEIIRTRDENVIKTGDYVVDVGSVYDEKLHRFDHHQSGGAGVRENGIPYASFGLVWKFCGEKLCGSKEIAEAIDRKLVQPIDANDNGVDIVDHKFPDIKQYLIQDFFRAFEPTWKENTPIDSVFLELVEIAKKILVLEIKRAQHKKEASIFVKKAYDDAEDKRLIILDEHWPWWEIVMACEEPLFVVYPERNKNWCARAIQKNPGSFVNRKDFPAAWAGKRDEELAEITDVPDAIFCHNKLFTCYARSKEGATALAKLALNS